jgi:hypothetical protein
LLRQCGSWSKSDADRKWFAARLAAMTDALGGVAGFPVRTIRYELSNVDPCTRWIVGAMGRRRSTEPSLTSVETNPLVNWTTCWID